MWKHAPPSFSLAITQETPAALFLPLYPLPATFPQEGGFGSRDDEHKRDAALVGTPRALGLGAWADAAMTEREM
jgi:hypothetical protein